MSYRNRGFLKDKHPEIAEALDDVMNSVQTVMEQTNVSTQGPVNPPPPVSAVSVRASGGIYDVSITDNSSPVSRGINYFVEYSTSPAFVAPVVIDLGASRNWRGFLGNQTLYFRAYSAYPTSARSTPAYFGNPSTPSPVLGGGATTGPSPLPSNGSGTSVGSNGADGGFGNQPFRGNRMPPRA